MFTKMRSLMQAQITYVFCFCFIYHITNSLSSDKISDKRLCADRECITMISKGKALASHKHADPAFLSFTRGDYIKIYSKSAGTRQDLWGGELNGKKGYFPRSFVREMKAEVPNPQYEVETEPHVPLKDRVLGKTPSQPPPAQKKEEPVKQTEHQGEPAKQPETKPNPTETEEVKKESSQEQTGTDNKLDTEPEKDETEIDDDETEVDDDETELDETETEDVKYEDEKNIQQNNNKEEFKDTADDVREKPVQDADDKTDVDETDLDEDQDTDSDGTELDETELDDEEEEVKIDNDETDEKPDDTTGKKDEAAKQEQPHDAVKEKADIDETKTEKPSDDLEKEVEPGEAIVDETEVGEEDDEANEDGSLFSRMFSGEGEGKVSEEKIDLEKENEGGDKDNNPSQVEDDNNKKDEHIEKDNAIPVLEKDKVDKDTYSQDNRNQINYNNLLKEEDDKQDKDKTDDIDNHIPVIVKDISGDEQNSIENENDKENKDKTDDIDNHIPVLDKDTSGDEQNSTENENQENDNKYGKNDIDSLSEVIGDDIKDEKLEINNDIPELDKDLLELDKVDENKSSYNLKEGNNYDKVQGENNEALNEHIAETDDNLLNKIIHEHIDNKENDHQEQIEKDNTDIRDKALDDNNDNDKRSQESDSNIVENIDIGIDKEDSYDESIDIEDNKEKHLSNNLAESQIDRENAFNNQNSVDNSKEIDENGNQLNDLLKDENVDRTNDMSENWEDKIEEKHNKPSDTAGRDTPADSTDSTGSSQHRYDTKEDDDNDFEEDDDDDDDIYDDDLDNDDVDDSRIIADSKKDEAIVDLPVTDDDTEAVTGSFSGDKKGEEQAKDEPTSDEKTEEQTEPLEEDGKPVENVEETETTDKGTDAHKEKPDTPAGTEERQDEVVKENNQDNNIDDVLMFINENGDTENEENDPKATNTKEMQMEKTETDVKQEPETPDAPDDSNKAIDEAAGQDKTVVVGSESSSESIDKTSETVEINEKKDSNVLDITPTLTDTAMYESETDQSLTQINTDTYETDTNLYNTDTVYTDTQYIDTASDTLADTNSQIQASFSTSFPPSEDVTSIAEIVLETVATSTDIPIEDGYVIDGTTFPAEYFGEATTTASTAVYENTPIDASFTDTGVYSTEQSQTTGVEALQATETQSLENVQASVTDETLQATTFVDSVENIETSVTEVSTFSTYSTAEPLSASPDVDPTAVVKTDLPVDSVQETETPSYTSIFDSASLEPSSSSLVHVLGTSFNYASSVTETGNTVPIDNVNSASVNVNISETGEAVREPSVEDNMYQAANFLSRKPLSSESSTQNPGASVDHQPELTGDQQKDMGENNQITNNLNIDNIAKDLNYNKDLNIPPTEETKSGEMNNNFEQTTQAWKSPDISDQNFNNVQQKEDLIKIDKDYQSITPPTINDKQSPDDYIAISRKVPDPFLDEEVAKPQESLLQSLEPMLKYIVQVLPPSILSVLEQEPLGLSPTMAVLVTIVTMKVVFLFTVMSCLCKGGKKSSKQDPIVIIQGLEEKLFITTKEKENMEDELQIQKKKCKELEQEMNSQQSNTGTVEMDLKTVRLHNEALKKQVMTLQQEVTDYKHEVTEKTQDIKQKASVIAEYERELDSLTGRSQESEQVVHKTSQALSEKEDEIRLLQSQVESLSEQVTQQQTRKQQLEEEATEWNEKVNELTEQVEQFTQDSRRMQDDLAFKENELEVLRDCFLQVKAFQGEDEMKEEEEERSPADLEEKLKAMMDVSRINASLRAVEEEKDVLQNKLKIEVESRKEMEDQIQQLKRKMETNQSDKMKAERQSQESQTRLEVLSKYFKEKEAELARQLGEQEVLKNQNLSKLESSDSITQELHKENDVYRQQIDELKMEITKADRDFRSQIAANEKKAHDNWLATRAAERELKESRHECGMLRQKLTDLERKLMQGPPGLIRPITHRGMPPPGMLNGPPPPPPDRPGSRGSVHITPGHVTPRLRDDDYRASPLGHDRIPPPDRRMPPGPRPPPPPMDARSPPPYGIRPPYPGDRRSPPPFDRYPPSRGPMGPRGPRPPFPGGPLPPPPHIHSPPPRSPPSEHDDSRQGPGYRGPQGSRDRGPPPPRHQSQV